MSELLEDISQEQEAERSGVFRPGAVWRTSWGYDQINVEFFEVVKETPGTVTLRRLKSNGVSEGPGYDRVYPVEVGDKYAIDFHLEGNPGTPTSERDRARGYSEKVCRKPRRSRRGYYGLSLRVDDVRYAYPYSGGGMYETALGFGH